MQTRRAEISPRAVPAAIVIGLGLVAGYVVLLLILMNEGSYDAWAVMLLVPLMMLVSLPVLRRQAAREGDPRVFKLLTLALLVKLGGSIARYYVAFSLYGGVADATGYHNAGVKLFEQFRHLDFAPLLHATGTEFLRVFTGLVYAIIGPTRLGGFLFYAWLGFWGLFLFYRAFVVAVPEGRRRSYAILLFFLPSLVFWPSSIGKESWMMFALGIATLGIAIALSGQLWRGLAMAAVGFWLAGIVRPHIAALLGAAFALAMVARRGSRELHELAPVMKALSMAVVAVLALFLTVKAERFLQRSGIPTSKGVSATLTDIQDRTSKGGSDFVPSVVDSPARAPLAVVTVLFRPFLPEAHNLQARLAAVEGTFLILLCLFRWRWLIAAIRSIRGWPYVLFALVYTGLFIIAFSSFANFGLLARERVQLYPLFLVLLCIPPAVREQARSGAEAAGAAIT